MMIMVIVVLLILGAVAAAYFTGALDGLFGGRDIEFSDLKDEDKIDVYAIAASTPDGKLNDATTQTLENVDWKRENYEAWLEKQTPKFEAWKKEFKDDVQKDLTLPRYFLYQKFAHKKTEADGDDAQPGIWQEHEFDVSKSAADNKGALAKIEDKNDKELSKWFC